MIKITMTNKQKEKIEEIYWNWIKTYHLEELKDIIRKDQTVYTIICNDEKDNETAIKKYLLTDAADLIYIKQKFDNSSRKVKVKTKNYMLARYKNFRDSQAAKIVKELELIACPYCNQNHLNVIYDKNGKLRYWGDLDHFFDKSSYPAMALCLYNLIPVCKVCNQTKSNKKKNITNPYDVNYKSKIMFETDFDEKLDLGYLQGKSQNFNIKVSKHDMLESDKNELELFALEARYKDMKRNVQEIIIKSKAYDKSYNEILKSKFDIDEEELKKYVYGFSERHTDRILSKFNEDIMKEFLS